MNKRKYQIISMLTAVSIMASVGNVWGTEKETMADAGTMISILNEQMGKENAGSTELSDEQLNSINMLNYLTVLTQEINSSKNSRLYLEKAYSSLINNTYPNAVDSRTLVELTSLLDILEDYRMLAVKRERLDYIYEQNCAQAMKAAMPNPIGLLSAVNSFSLSKIAASVAYMAIDSYTSYTAYTAEADLKHLQEGWALDDEESKNLHESRKATFEYMIEMVNNYNLPGELSLNEKAVEEFVKWENESNIVQRIQILESNEKIYQAFGEYWLALADCYYQNEDYGQCLNAVEHYRNLDIHIFRKDYNLAKILPLAVASAAEVLDKKEYIDTVEVYVKEIQDNSEKSDWKLQYFAAQTYIDLYAKTNDISHMEKAYELILSNVTYLVADQKSANEKYFAEIKEEKAEDGATKDEKKEIKEYNKMLKEERKTALPPVYEPLALNCEMLFSLAQELNISEDEKSKIDGILHENGEDIFMLEQLDNRYRFTEEAEVTSENGMQIEFDGSEIKVPVRYVSDSTKIKVTVEEEGEKVTYEDWKIEEVDREEENNLDSFIAVYASDGADKHKYKEDGIVRIEITPRVGIENEIYGQEYKAVDSKKLLVVPDIEFEKVEK